jgi:hypothetical protein
MVNQNTVQMMYLNEIRKTVMMESLIVIKGHVVRILISVKYYGVRRVHHQSNVMKRILMAVDMEIADMISSRKNISHVRHKMQSVGCCNAVI